MSHRLTAPLAIATAALLALVGCASSAPEATDGAPDAGETTSTTSVFSDAQTGLDLGVAIADLEPLSDWIVTDYDADQRVFVLVGQYEDADAIRDWIAEQDWSSWSNLYLGDPDEPFIVQHFSDAGEFTGQAVEGLEGGLDLRFMAY